MAELLSAEEEHALVLDGSPEALGKLVLAHRPIALRVARAFESDRCEREDLVAEGMVALVVAAQKFDGGRGTRFGPYARTAVQRAVVRYLAVNDHGAFRLPESVWDDIRIARRHMVRDERQAALVALGEPPVSLALPLPEGGEFGDLLSGDLNARSGTGAPIAFDVERVLRFVTPRERKAIVLRFGLDGGAEPMDFKSVARSLNVSVRTARRDVRTGLDRIRDARQAAEWRMLIDDEEQAAQIA